MKKRNKSLEERWKNLDNLVDKTSIKFKSSHSTGEQRERLYLTLHNHRTYLTSREIEVGILLIKLSTYKAIAEKLNISRRTVESYTSHMKHKLGCDTKDQLIHCLAKFITIKNQVEAE